MNEDQTTVRGGVPNAFDRHSPNGYRNQQNFEDLMFHLLDRSAVYVSHFSTGINQFMTQYRITETAGTIWNGLKRYPLVALCLAAFIFVLSLPFVLFIVFTVGTAIMTFTGFVVIEGTLVTVASMLLIGALISVGCMIGSMGLLLVVGYFGVFKMYGIYERWRAGGMNFRLF